MSITSASTIAEIMTANNDWKYSDTDLTAWKKLTGAASDAVTIQMGLTGLELTDFLKDCATATTNCKEADYAKYNGWALGIYWSTATATTSMAEVRGVCWDLTKKCVENAFDDANNVVTTYTSDVAIATDAPINTKVGTPVPAANPFTAWGAAATKLATQTAY